jgi:hypothetical protein
MLVPEYPGLANQHAYPDKNQEQRKENAKEIHVKHNAKYGCQSDQD